MAQASALRGAPGAEAPEVMQLGLPQWSHGAARKPLEPDAETKLLPQDMVCDMLLDEGADDDDVPTDSARRHIRRTPADEALAADSCGRQAVHRERPEVAPPAGVPKQAAPLVLLACFACVGAIVLYARQWPGARGAAGDFKNRSLEVPVEVPLDNVVVAPAGGGAAAAGGAPGFEVGATAAPTPAPTPPPCAGSGESCLELRCCAAAGEQCYELRAAGEAKCMADCRAGPDMTDLLELHNQTCLKLGPRTPGRAKTAAKPTSAPVPRWAEEYCSSGKDDCRETRCCAEEGMQCYAKDEARAQCKPSCTPAGPDMTDVDGEPWSCKEIGPRTPGVAAEPSLEDLVPPAWVKTSCSVSGENCTATKCCSQEGFRCYAKNREWSSCKPDCVPGPQPEDRADENWTCSAMGPQTPGLAERVPVRRGSFLVVGDWGWDEVNAGSGKHVATGKCQADVARAMDAKMSELGDVKFVVNVGDSFYASGVRDRDDEQWDKKWRWIYSVQLRSVPWYSVYGNHDYHQDPCACSNDLADCAQVNYEEDNLEYFQMPGTSYFKEFPGMGIEVVGLDLNNFCDAPQSPEDSAEHLVFKECFMTDCLTDCIQVMKNRTRDGLDLFLQRAKESTAKSLVVFSHYPTDYLTGAPDLLEALMDNSRHNITYFGGHRHSVDNTSTLSIEPNKNWLVGGGGGFSCDSEKQGFVVGEIWGDSSVTTYPVLVDFKCCSS